MAWVVTAAVAVARVAGADRYVYRGAALPEGTENVEHLAAVGLIAEAPAQPAVTKPRSSSK